MKITERVEYKIGEQEVHNQIEIEFEAKEYDYVETFLHSFRLDVENLTNNKKTIP